MNFLKFNRRAILPFCLRVEISRPMLMAVIGIVLFIYVSGSRRLFLLHLKSCWPKILAVNMVILPFNEQCRAMISEQRWTLLF